MPHLTLDRLVQFHKVVFMVFNGNIFVQCVVQLTQPLLNQYNATLLDMQYQHT